MNQQNNGKRTANRGEPPRRVQNAAGKIMNTSSQGVFRGYVPQQTGSQQLQHAVPTRQFTGSENNNGNGTRGFGTAGGSKGRPHKKGKAIRTVLITVLALALIAGAAYYGIQVSRDLAKKKLISDKVSPYDELYCPGVYVDGIHLGGMTPEQAMNSVQSQISQRSEAWKVQLVFEGQVVAEITSDMLNMTVDQNQLINVMNEAWTYGHTGSQYDRYVQMEELEQNPHYSYTAKPNGDTSELDRLMATIKSNIDIPVQDAALISFEPSRAYPFVFSHEVVGRTLDTEPILEQLYQMVSTMTSGTIELVPTTVQPEVLQAELEMHYALRASVKTPIDRHSDDNRNNNIRRCFEFISGTVLEPGETFSFNKIVGERSLENGFYPATEYINDEHVTGVGGGACQASTTLYQAAVRSGLQIISRRPHSDSVSYAEYGTDATVYWMKGGKQIDMSFKNNTEGKIYIVAEVIKDSSVRSGLSAKVSIYGESLGNVTYKLETETIETLPSIMEPVYVKDKESAAKAKDGCIVDSYRMKYVDGILTERTFLFRDTYNPKPEKIYDPSLAKD